MALSKSLKWPPFFFSFLQISEMVYFLSFGLYNVGREKKLNHNLLIEATLYFYMMSNVPELSIL